MEKFDFDSKKYVLLLVLVCLVFFILIVKAFDYLPESEENSVKRQNNITIDENYNSPIQNNNYSEEQTEQKQLDQSSGTFVLNESTISNNEESTTALVKENPKFDEIKAPAGVGLEPIEEAENASTASDDKKSVETEMTPQEKAELALMTGNKLKKMNDLKGALAEYQKVPELTKDKELVAESYEGIATLYAITKRYGTALNYASKAYNTAPNSSREMLLARLYYKTGDIDKATRRVNNVLHRDFSDDVK